MAKPDWADEWLDELLEPAWKKAKAAEDMFTGDALGSSSSSDSTNVAEPTGMSDIWDELPKMLHRSWGTCKTHDADKGVIEENAAAAVFSCPVPPLLALLLLLPVPPLLALLLLLPVPPLPA